MGPNDATLVTHHAVSMERIDLHAAQGWVWKVGSEDVPAGQEEINYIMELLKKIAEDESYNTMVLHHRINIEPLSTNTFKAVFMEEQKVVQLTALTHDAQGNPVGS